MSVFDSLEKNRSNFTGTWFIDDHVYSVRLRQPPHFQRRLTCTRQWCAHMHTAVVCTHAHGSSVHTCTHAHCSGVRRHASNLVQQQEYRMGGNRFYTGNLPHWDRMLVITPNICHIKIASCIPYAGCRMETTLATILYIRLVWTEWRTYHTEARHWRLDNLLYHRTHSRQGSQRDRGKQIHSLAFHFYSLSRQWASNSLARAQTSSDLKLMVEFMTFKT